jgi:hypothetical protein
MARSGLAPIPGLPTYRTQPWFTSIARWSPSTIRHLLIVTGHGFVEWDGSYIRRYPGFPSQLGCIVYNVIQKPFFYQTTTFRLAVVTAGVLLLAGLYQLRPPGRSAVERAAGRAAGGTGTHCPRPARHSVAGLPGPHPALSRCNGEHPGTRARPATDGIGTRPCR